MKRLAIALLTLVLMTACSQAPAEKDVYRIGVLQLADHPSLDATLTGMKETLDETLGSDKYEIIFHNAQGNAVDAATMAGQLVNDGVDLIYAIATLSAQAALNATQDIPIVFNAVTDPMDAGLVASLESPGGNVTGISDAAPIDKQMALIKEILPDVQNVGILYNVGEPNSAIQVNQTKDAAEKIGIHIEVSGISQASELQLAAQALSSKVDAMYVITDNMVVSGIATLIDQTNKANIPVFAAESGQFDKGILASESISYLDLGRTAGKVVRDILVDGKDPGTIAVQGANETELLISETVAEALGIDLPEAVLSRANNQ